MKIVNQLYVSLALLWEGHSDKLRVHNRRLSGHQNYFILDNEEKNTIVRL
jgi:hypothetical protein